MPQWLLILTQILTLLPQVTPELEAFLQSIIDMANGMGTHAQASSAAQAVVDKVKVESGGQAQP